MSYQVNKKIKNMSYNLLSLGYRFNRKFYFTSLLFLSDLTQAEIDLLD